jgi:hypothetical protein
MPEVIQTGDQRRVILDDCQSNLWGWPGLLGIIPRRKVLAVSWYCAVKLKKEACATLYTVD